MSPWEKQYSASFLWYIFGLGLVILSSLPFFCNTSVSLGSIFCIFLLAVSSNFYLNTLCSSPTTLCSHGTAPTPHQTSLSSRHPVLAKCHQGTLTWTLEIGKIWVSRIISNNSVSISKVSLRVIFKSLKYPQACFFLLVERRVTKKGWKKSRLWKVHLIAWSASSLSSGSHWGHVRPCDSTWIKHSLWESLIPERKYHRLSLFDLKRITWNSHLLGHLCLLHWCSDCHNSLILFVAMVVGRMRILFIITRLFDIRLLPLQPGHTKL